MAINVTPLVVDTKGLSVLTGFCRQRLHEIRKNPNFEFPEPIKIGRSVRYPVAAIMEWLQKMEGKNAKPMPSIATQKPIAAAAPKASETQKQGKPAAPKPAIANPAVAIVKGKSLIVVAGVNPRTLRYFEQVSLSRTLTVDIRKRIRYMPGAREAIAARQAEEQKQNDLLARSFQSNTESLPASLSPELQTFDPKQSHSASPERLTADYESGMTLDALCKRYRMGKARVSSILRQNDAKIRSPGRKPRAKRHMAFEELDRCMARGQDGAK